jgi:hypothetical protein
MAVWMLQVHLVAYAANHVWAQGAAVVADKGPTVLDYVWSIVKAVTGERDYTEPHQPRRRQEQGEESSSSRQQPLYVIGAGLPRTGSLSFTVALQKLGLRSYHMTQGVIDTPGHINLWYRHYVVENQGSVSKDDIFDEIAAQGFNATADAPSCFAFEYAMERYPNAKVVLNVRGHDAESSAGEAWKESVTSTILAIKYLLRKIPFRWSTPMYQFEVLHRHMLQQELLDGRIVIDPITQHVVEDQLPAAYTAWIEKVQRLVPPEKLLIHAAQDGWPPLCDFLTSSSSDSSSPLLFDTIQSKCREILQSGEPYPHANDNAKIYRLLFLLRIVNQVFEKGPFVILLLVGALVVRRKRRNEHRRQQQEREANKTK